jgi:hypothetical protein
MEQTAVDGGIAIRDQGTATRTLQGIVSATSAFSEFCEFIVLPCPEGWESMKQRLLRKEEDDQISV